MSQNETDIIPIYELIALYSILYIISLVSGYYYLSYYIDKKIISISLFIFCLFYFSLFIFLQFISNLDLLFHTTPYKLLNNQIFIQIFYDFLNTFSLILNYVIFPIYIQYSKSGYFTLKYRIKDIFCYHYIINSIKVAFIILGIIIFIIFNEQILDYYGRYKFFLNYLNFKGLIEIYLNVGFFIVYLIVDCRRKLSKNFDILFSDMILEKVNKKAEEDIKEINAAYQELYNNVILSHLKNTHIDYYNYISSIISKSRQNNDIYKINYKVDGLTQDNNNLNYKNSEYSENNDNSNNIINEEMFNNNDSYNGKLENNENNEMLIIKEDFNQIEKDLSKPVRQFKKGLRKIKRLKDLYEMLDEVNKDNSNKTCLSKAWNYFKFFMYFTHYLLL